MAGHLTAAKYLLSCKETVIDVWQMAGEAIASLCVFFAGASGAILIHLSWGMAIPLLSTGGGRPLLEALGYSVLSLSSPPPALRPPLPRANIYLFGNSAGEVMILPEVDFLSKWPNQ